MKNDVLVIPWTNEISEILDDVLRSAAADNSLSRTNHHSARAA
jgi:hypothetical protein